MFNRGVASLPRVLGLVHLGVAMPLNHETLQLWREIRMILLISMVLNIPDEGDPYIACECGEKFHAEDIPQALQDWRFHLMAQHLTHTQNKELM